MLQSSLTVEQRATSCTPDMPKNTMNVLLYPLEHPIIPQNVDRSVRGHNFRPSSLENPRAQTPNVLRRSETPYVPPHRRRSHNRPPSPPPPWNSERYLGFQLKANSEALGILHPSPNLKQELGGELRVTSHSSIVVLFTSLAWLSWLLYLPLFYFSLLVFVYSSRLILAGAPSYYFRTSC